eukprot:7305924-Prymnesium_polylepis.1
MKSFEDAIFQKEHRENSASKGASVVAPSCTIMFHVAFAQAAAEVPGRRPISSVVLPAPRVCHMTSRAAVHPDADDGGERIVVPD